MIVFDWDGTLCDSVAQIIAAVQQSAAGMGLGGEDDAAVVKVWEQLSDIELPPGDS